MSGKTATVIGSTGLIGSQLLEQLQLDKSFGTIRAVVRHPVSFSQSKVEMKLVNFDDAESLKLAINGSDVVFSAIGTTQKKVKGNKEAYRKIDHNITVHSAQYCYETGCNNFCFVSSVDANSKSNNFYLKLKGETEEDVKQFPIKSISAFRPSILTGKRKESRLGEKIGMHLANFFAFVMMGTWEKYRPVSAKTVAKAMIEISKEEIPGSNIYEFASIAEKGKPDLATENLRLAEQ